MLCLDWTAAAPDGVEAVPGELRARIERLTSLGVDVAVVAEAGLDGVEPRLGARPDVEGRLFLLLSDGLEAYVTGPGGPRLLDRRPVSSDEEDQLDMAAAAVRDVLAERDLDASLTSPSRGRRVLLVGGTPSHEGAGADGAGGSGNADGAGESENADGAGTNEDLVALATSQAHEAGLARPRVMLRDGRLEIALTDVADSMRWLVHWVIRYRDYDAREVLVVGDDFAGRDATGGDRRLMIPELHGATFASVGPEPEVAPRRVKQLGGGPEAVLDLLDEQIVLREERVLESFPSPNPDTSWLLQVEGFDPFREREVETWLTVANGETGTRGSLEEGSAASTPATFVNGVYGDDTGELQIRQPVVAP
ncbi:MAG TPA: hypothetical protein VK576_11915, partial [Thermoleophilia bacterium]|nr:hypothetical protein [Thermoleophilia bacterium]